jgi:alpha-beta hydrolase superfamily lysophospholipase
VVTALIDRMESAGLVQRQSSDADGRAVHLFAAPDFGKLTNVPYKRYVEFGEGTHTVMMEKNRVQFFHEVAAFLEEAGPQALK